VEFLHIECVVYQPFPPTLSVHQDHHAQHRWHGHVLLQNHAIPVPVVSATDCILEATHRLTAAIESVQEAAPVKLQAIKSLRHILLGKQIPQVPCQPPPTPLNDSNVDEEPILMWDPTVCTQPILPFDATQRAPQTGHAIIDNDDTPPLPISPVHMGSPTIIDDNDNASPMVRCPWT
jgi:hypothetical protein